MSEGNGKVVSGWDPKRGVYVLEVPITHPAINEGQPVKELALKRLKGRDMRAAKDAVSELDRNLAFIASSAGIPPSAVDELDGSDVNGIAAVLQVFFAPGRETGPAR